MALQKAVILLFLKIILLIKKHNFMYFITKLVRMSIQAVILRFSRVAQIPSGGAITDSWLSHAPACMSTDTPP
jgi:hypothetical protein